WFGQPWWPFPMFTLAFLSMLLVYRGLDLWLPARLARRQSVSPGSRRALVETLLLFTLVYLLSGFGNASPAFLSALFYGTFLIRLCVSYERGFMLLIGLLLS